MKNQIKNYIKEMRSKIGNQTLLIPAARIVIQRADGKVLFQQRSDFKTWCVPGGCSEIGERVEETIIRETKEETGLTISNPIPFGHSSDSNYELISYPQGGDIHFHVVLFYTNNYTGNLSSDDSETLNLQWFDLSNLPPMLLNMKKTIEAYLLYKESGLFQLI